MTFQDKSAQRKKFQIDMYEPVKDYHDPWL